jgi:hypothetical protein
MALPRASARDTAAFAADVVVPLLARDVIERRPRVVDGLDRVDADRRPVRRFASACAASSSRAHIRRAEPGSLEPIGTTPAPIPRSCAPGSNLVLRVTISLLAKLVAVRAPRQTPRAARADRPVPATLSPFRLTFEMAEPG